MRLAHCASGMGLWVSVVLCLEVGLALRANLAASRGLRPHSVLRTPSSILPRPYL